MQSCSQYAASSCSYIFPCTKLDSRSGCSSQNKDLGLCLVAPSPPSQMSPLFLAACPWPSLPHSPSQLDICNTNRRKVSINPTISQLLLPTSILLLPLSLSHYKYLLRPWEEVGKPFQVRTENGGETINLIESSLRFLWDLINTRLRSGWCGMTWAVRMTAVSHCCLFWGLCQLVMVMWASAFIYVSNWSKLYP